MGSMKKQLDNAVGNYIEMLVMRPPLKEVVDNNGLIKGAIMDVGTDYVKFAHYQDAETARTNPKNLLAITHIPFHAILEWSVSKIQISAGNKFRNAFTNILK